LRWGGLAGVLGSVVFIFVFVWVIAMVGMETVEPEEMVMRFPEIRAARTVENSLYLAVLVLWVPHYLALYRALRGSSPAGALFGSVLGIVGLVVLIAGALPHVATLPISDLYRAPGTTPEAQAALVAMWQASWAIYDALFIAGLAVVPIGVTVLGIAMLGASAFGKSVGWVSVVLGVLGMVAAIVLLIDPASPSAFGGVLALIIFHLVTGVRILNLSRSTH
jgi:hypothetical protein